MSTSLLKIIVKVKQHYMVYNKPEKEWVRTKVDNADRIYEIDYHIIHIVCIASCNTPGKKKKNKTIIKVS